MFRIPSQVIVGYDIINQTEKEYKLIPYFVSSKNRIAVFTNYQILDFITGQYLGDISIEEVKELNNLLFILDKRGYIFAKNWSDLSSGLEIYSNRHNLAEYMTYAVQKNILECFKTGEIKSVDALKNNISVLKTLNTEANRLHTIGNGIYKHKDDKIRTAKSFYRLLDNYLKFSQDSDNTAFPYDENLIRFINENLEKLQKEIMEMEKYVNLTKQKQKEIQLKKEFEKRQLNFNYQKQFNISFLKLGLKSKEDVYEMFYALTGRELKIEYKDWILGLRTPDEVLNLTPQELIDKIEIMEGWKKVWREDIENYYKNKYKSYELSEYEQSKIENISEDEILPWEKYNCYFH